MRGFALQTLSGPTLPPSLRDLPSPPRRIFVHGFLPRGPKVAIVGTRSPTAPARRYAEWLASRLAEQGVAVLSGGAAGIDAAAHQGALDAGGVTVVVGPSSFDRPYPEEHAELFGRIVERGGAYVSTYARGVVPRRHQFFRRNSILVALSQLLVIVEAPLRSGALNAARWARDLGRPCFVVPSPPWNPAGRGCIGELQRGARALASPDDLLGWLRDHEQHAIPLPGAPSRRVFDEPPGAELAHVAPPHPAGRQRAAGSEPPRTSATTGDLALDEMLKAIRAGCTHPDDIGRALSLGAAVVSHGLLRLTLLGLIVQGSAGEIRSAD